MLNNVLVTGGTGTFGQALARRLLKEPPYRPSRIVIFSRGELRQAEMAEEFKELDPDTRLRFLIGCVRDRDRLRRAMTGIGTVIHAAALKRIEVGKYNPIEMVKTNIDGAINVIEAAQDAGVKKVVALSSDKAWQPVSPYGCSKALAESLFLAADNTMAEDGPRFAVVRYGNVWASNGSVVPRWKALVAAGATHVPVTDMECTRFFMTVEQAVQLVADTVHTMNGGELVVPDLPAYCLRDLASAMGVHMTTTGLPDWEKKHEGMADGNTSDKARRMTVEELRGWL